jgi:hypothetical protein
VLTLLGAERELPGLPEAVCRVTLCDDAFDAMTW